MRDDREDYLHDRVKRGNWRDRIKADLFIFSILLGASLILDC